MDSLVTAAARALAAGDPVAALQRVALREDPPALALRGIAMAQLGEHARARDLLRRAARAFGPGHEVARARCIVAEAEVALHQRDLGQSADALLGAMDALDRHADRANALQARLVLARRQLLLGHLDAAETVLATIDERDMPPSMVAVRALTAAELALRRLRITMARQALEVADEAAKRAAVPALLAEVAQMRAELERPAARRIGPEHTQMLRLGEVAALLASDTLVIDGCRRGLGAGSEWCALASRPVLFTLACALAEAWPGEISRDALILRAFRMRHPDASHRARLRVEIGRLRACLGSLAAINATTRGYVLLPHGGREVAVLRPPVDDSQSTLAALLADGAAWSTSSLSLASGLSQRSVQRALAALERLGHVRAIGQARARRWITSPLSGFTTILLLPASLPIE